MSKQSDIGLNLYEQKNKYYYSGSNPLILKRIKPGATTVLDVGCAEGNLGAAIRKQGVRVYGLELFPAAAEEAAKKLDHVLCGDIETIDLPYKEQQFDYITFGDVLEHLKDPWAVLRKVKPFLKPSGSIVACIPNVGHVSIIAELLAGNWTYVEAGLLDQTHYRFFTLNGIKELFRAAGYQLTDIERIPQSNPVYDHLLHHLEAVRQTFHLGSAQFPVEAKTFQYVVEAIKGADG